MPQCIERIVWLLSLGVASCLVYWGAKQGGLERNDGETNGNLVWTARAIRWQILVGSGVYWRCGGLGLVVFGECRSHVPIDPMQLAKFD